ncbi:MAG: hypothetical protein AB7I50_20495 [Vicinamibacterales bacterium]
MSTLSLLLAITIRVYDGYALPSTVLDQAVMVAGATFAEAGFTADFIVCEQTGVLPGCQHPPGPKEIVLRLQAGPRDGDKVLGTAFIDRATGTGTLASLNALVITEVARRADVDLAPLLGRALAHEVGHLLLGRTSHSPRGLMRRLWTDAELRGSDDALWRFTGDEVAAILERLSGSATSATTAESGGRLAKVLK